MNKLARSFSRLSLLIAIACLMATLATAQSNRQLIRSGNKLFDRENYREAAPYFERVIANDPNNAEALYMAGVSYVTFDKEKSIDYITRAYTIKPNIDRDIEYWLGRVNHLNYRFDDAIKYYQAYQPKIRRRDDVRRDEVAQLIQHSQNAKREVANPKDVFVKNLGGNINSSYSEHSPVISSDERYLLFTSRGEEASGGRKSPDGEFYEDIFETRKLENNEWEKPRSIAGNLSSTVHDASIQLFDNDTKMLLYRSQNNGDILYSERNSEGNWGPPVSIGDNINSADFESDAYITPDGQTLYYSTSHFSENGDLDIYIARREANGQWGKPESIGTTINTGFDDDSPYLSQDGTLYFASRGHNTMGGYDIFSAKYDSVARRWGRPINLGSPVNTPDDDTYYRLSPDGSYAYLTSYRIGGYGEKDIYTINYIRTVRLVGQVFSLPDSVVMPGVELIFSGTQADKRPITYRDITRPDSGNYEVSVLSGRNYQVQVLKDGKSIVTQELEVPMVLNDTTSITRNFYVPYTDVTKPVSDAMAFKKIYFDTDQYDLRSESVRELDNIAKVLKANPGMNLSIEGHCDFRASDEYNMELGDNRAKAAFDYLVAQGIAARRLVTVSYGERRPAVPNTSAENMQLNRRTEFRIIERQPDGSTTPKR